MPPVVPPLVPPVVPPEGVRLPRLTRPATPADGVVVSPLFVPREIDPTAPVAPPLLRGEVAPTAPAAGRERTTRSRTSVERFVSRRKYGVTSVAGVRMPAFPSCPFQRRLIAAAGSRT